MKNKYNTEVSQLALTEYCTSLIGRVYKLLPMREDLNHPDAWKVEYYKLLRELSSGENYLNNSGLFYELIFKLESAENLEHIPYRSEFRKAILESIDIVKKIIEDVSRMEA